MIVIADATPLNYLILIGHSEILAALYGRVLIPEAVYEELQRDDTPDLVREQIATPPAWMEVRRISRPTDVGLQRLHLGEREAIALAEELRADLVMMDEKDGRRAAQERHLKVIGTLGVLDEAAKVNLIDLPGALMKLQNTNFRADERLLQAFLQRDAERKRQHPPR